MCEICEHVKAGKNTLSANMLSALKEIGRMCLMTVDAKGLTLVTALIKIDMAGKTNEFVKVLTDFVLNECMTEEERAKANAITPEESAHTLAELSLAVTEQEAQLQAQAELDRIEKLADKDPVAALEALADLMGVSAPPPPPSYPRA